MIAKNFKDIVENLEVDDVVLLKGQFVNFQGNVTKINSNDSVFELYITHSNDEDAIGNIVPINDEVMNSVFESLEIKKHKRMREDYLAIIDLALDLKNEDLFKYTCKQLEEFDLRTKFIESRKIS